MAEKKKISVRIAGRFLNVLTDEDPAAVRQIESELNAQVDALGKSSPRMATRDGKMDAVILCAFDALNRERKAVERIAEAEAAAAEFGEKYRALLREYARIADADGQRMKMREEQDPEGRSETGGAASDRSAGEDGYRETLGRIREILAAIRDRGRLGE